MFMGLLNCFEFVNDDGLAQKMKPLPQLNKLIKCFDKINENVGVNRALVPDPPFGSGRGFGSRHF